MRTAAVTLGLVLALSSCGLIEDEESDDAAAETTLPDSTTEPADDAEQADGKKKPSKKQQRKKAARQKQQFVEACVELVPTMAFLGDRQSLRLWDDANEKKKRLRAACTEIAESKPKQQARLLDKFEQTQAFLRENAQQPGRRNN